MAYDTVPAYVLSFGDMAMPLCDHLSLGMRHKIVRKNCINV